MALQLRLRRLLRQGMLLRRLLTILSVAVCPHLRLRSPIHSVEVLLRLRPSLIHLVAAVAPWKAEGPHLRHLQHRLSPILFSNRERIRET